MKKLYLIKIIIQINYYLLINILENNNGL